MKIYCLFLSLACSAVAEDHWSQFRGPNSTGISDSRGLPLEFGTGINVTWKTPVPSGKSSPVFADERIFLTAHDNERLQTIAIDQRTGRVLWTRDVVRSREERRHKLNDAAAPTPVTDGKNVYSFFADFGLVSYTAQGKPRWQMELPAMPSMQGVAGSPILAGGKLILVVDQAQDSYMIAVDPRNGETLWRKSRAPAPGGAYSSPVLYTPPEGETQLVTFSPFELAGFSVATGEKLWWVGGLPPQPKSTPLVDGANIYCLAKSFYGDGIPPIGAFEVSLKQNDANANGTIEKEEAPEGPAKRFFGVVDRNKDGHVDASEWQGMIDSAAPNSVLIAVRPRGRGDITSTAVRWRFERNIPDVPSPLLYKDVLYMLQNGGILTALNPETGSVLRQGRVTGALGDYYASPVAADGNLYTVSRDGDAAVIRAGAEWEVRQVNRLGEECYATPAIVDGALFVRTATALYRFESR
jgi:outer membrane protein assembly factor BamB